MTPIGPISISLDVSTVCQLKCPTCPTAEGKIKKHLGSRFLKIKTFKKLIDENPQIRHIELSNWGEIFLNPDLVKIFEYAYRKNVILTASNGTNLNTVKKRDMLEALVKYKVRHVTCSIDGACQETYSQYRIGGNFDNVIEHIKIINHYKTIYRSEFPMLLWQFIAFGHNEHEIQAARHLAQKLNMEFYVKLSWDKEISPVRNTELVRQQSPNGVASREEYFETYKTEYFQKHICKQLWQKPQINWDGRILGCCVNYWGDFGNIFATKQSSGFESKKMHHAKLMLMGKVGPKNGIPCTTCHHYRTMKQRQDWLTKRDLKESLTSRLVKRLAHHFGRPIVWIMNRSNWLGSLILRRAIQRIVRNLVS